MRSGEEVVAELQTSKFGANEEVVAYGLKNPCLLIPVPTKDGRGSSIALIPWMQTAKEDQVFMVPVDAVLFVAEPIDGLIAEYKSVFSKLIVPKAPALRLVQP